MKISIIAAIGPNRELGKDNKLLWHLPGDLPRFKKLTVNHAVIMGRKTFESIGKLLPDRLNVIITRQRNFFTRESPPPTKSGGPPSKVKRIAFASLLGVIDFLKFEIKNSKLNDEVFIIGGGQTYTQALSLADKLYLTLVEKTPEHPDGKFTADTFFPEYKHIFKKLISEEKREENGYKYNYIELIK